MLKSQCLLEIQFNSVLSLGLGVILQLSYRCKKNYIYIYVIKLNVGLLIIIIIIVSNIIQTVFTYSKIRICILC